jgi:hypothetical protein
MRVYDPMQTAQALAILFGQPVLYISFPQPSPVDDVTWDDLLKAAPYLDPVKHCQVLSDGYGFIICDTEEELYKLYDQTVGDDGPTKTNSYDGPARVYAMTIDADGELGNENT